MTKPRRQKRIMICDHCGLDFRSSRRDAKYHSAACRKAAERDRKALEAVTFAPVSVTFDDKATRDYRALRNQLAWYLKRAYEREDDE